MVGSQQWRTDALPGAGMDGSGRGGQADLDRGLERVFD